MGLWDLQIGESIASCSAIKIFGIKDDEWGNLSENNKEYWISDTLNLKLSGKINKEHRVGKKITKMLDDKVSARVIYNYVEKELYKVISYHDMISIMHNEKETSYYAGRQSKVNELEMLFKV